MPKNVSNKAYNAASKSGNAPASTRRPFAASKAHTNASDLSKIGGEGTKRGVAVSVHDKHNGGAKRSENIQPKNAHDFASFSGVGGCNSCKDGR